MQAFAEAFRDGGNDSEVTISKHLFFHTAIKIKNKIPEKLPGVFRELGGGLVGVVGIPGRVNISVLGCCNWDSTETWAGSFTTIRATNQQNSSSFLAPWCKHWKGKLHGVRGLAPFGKSSVAPTRCPSLWRAGSHQEYCSQEHCRWTVKPFVPYLQKDLEQRFFFKQILPENVSNEGWWDSMSE